KTFDWSLIEEEIKRPWFLAGGLGPDNLEDAIARLHPWGVDLSSSVETEKKKDRDKVKKVIEIVRSSR
ncbi:MAG: phosphoribosylanthranilate isomerase, partial [Lachnospiraceae bacterium]|nr:phosphoribosylanthranilate isomerase [Lachnospiraceae bacterium]